MRGLVWCPRGVSCAWLRWPQKGSGGWNPLGGCSGNSTEDPQTCSPSYTKAPPFTPKLLPPTTKSLTISQGTLLFYSKPGQHDKCHMKIKNVMTRCREKCVWGGSVELMITFAVLAMDRICTAMLIFYKNSKSYYPHAARPKIHNDTLIQLK